MSRMAAWKDGSIEKCFDRHEALGGGQSQDTQLYKQKELFMTSQTKHSTRIS